MAEVVEAATVRCSQLFGLTIRSVLPLPLAGPDVPQPDVEIVYGSVPEKLREATATEVRYQARPGQLLLRVDGVARYLVSEGCHITIERDPRADDDDVRLFLLGSVLGALLHQRGVLVLHGSAIVAGDAAVAFVGPSGFGKSTLAMAFARRGMPVLTDDLCVVQADPVSGSMQVHPGLPHAKLWCDSLEQLTIPSAELARVRRKIEKRSLPLGAVYASAPARLAHIYALQVSNAGELSLTRLHGPKKFDVLKRQTFRLRFIEGLGAKPTHFQSVLTLAQQASVSTVVRPQEPFRLDALADLIAADLSS